MIEKSIGQFTEVYDYDWDGFRNITEYVDKNLQEYFFEYDDLGRLQKEIARNGNIETSYEYFLAGNDGVNKIHKSVVFGQGNDYNFDEDIYLLPSGDVYTTNRIGFGGNGADYYVIRELDGIGRVIRECTPEEGCTIVEFIQYMLLSLCYYQLL